MRPPLQSGAARLAGVALLPAVFALCCPDQAAAGCGDYVQIVGPDGKVHSPTDHGPAPVRLPCRGPECTMGPRAPAPVPPPPPSGASDVKGLIEDMTDPAPCRADVRTAAGPSGSPVRRPTSIFHPPRS